MDKVKLLIVLGSIREGRSGGRVFDWFVKLAQQLDGVEVRQADLKEYDLPLFADEEMPSKRARPHKNAEVERWLSDVEWANAYVFVSPEYNHSISSALKNALDYPAKEWEGKAVGFVGYGSYAGGSRAVEHLRQIVAELRMYGVRDQVLIPTVWSAFDEGGNLINSELHERNAHLLLEEVVKLATALRTFKN